MNPNDRDDTRAQASLTLPIEGYRTWLDQFNPMSTVGYQPSAHDNPVARYVLESVGICNRLHSDGQRAWFFLRLTRGASSVCHLRMLLPDWAAPLVAYYTAYPVGQASSHPQEQEVSRTQALADLRRMVG